MLKGRDHMVLMGEKPEVGLKRPTVGRDGTATFLESSVSSRHERVGGPGGKVRKRLLERCGPARVGEIRSIALTIRTVQPAGCRACRFSPGIKAWAQGGRTEGKDLVFLREAK